KDGEFGPAMDSANGLWENYVNRNCQQQHKFYICPNGCKNGACVSDTPCTDSDGGKNYFVKGTTSGMTKTYYNGTESEKYSSSDDICVKDNQIPQSGYEEGLFEHYCENNYLQVDGSDKTFICPNVCEDGACVESNDNSEIKTRYAYWECSNGVSSKSGGPTSCKPRYIWEEYGNEFCRAQCGDMGCTLKKFDTWEKCGEIIDDILILPAVDLPVYTLPIDMAVDTTIRESEKCNGCFNNEICLPFGTRLLSNDLPSYCSINQKIVTQLGVDEPCMNSYECKTNQCASNVCIDLKQEIAETRGLLQKILDWLSQLFG
ncbi:hypothetical protein J4418_04255, partial [Candidatus Woesearchaeota archaeon]|nr:hypothetical protein [Candidatus Woesearchaeota archaeon]